MRERLRPILESLATFVAPGLLLLLLGIQVAFGLRGFDRPDGGLLYVLQVPGVLLGWGGVVLLLPLLAWMILDWWGYDLGGFALKGLGSAVLGIAAGALCGLAGDTAGGGLVGGGLAGVLDASIGSILALALLGLMAVPAAVLAFSFAGRAARPAARDAPAKRRATADARAKQRAKQHGTQRAHTGLLAHIKGRLRGGERDRAATTWYPERQFDAAGNEVPIHFGAERDVGAVQFVQQPEVAPVAAEPPPTAAVSEQATNAPETPPPERTIADLLAGEERLPTIPELLAGNYRGRAAQDGAGSDLSGGPRESPADLPDDGPIHVDSEGKAHQMPAAPRQAAVASVAPREAPREASVVPPRAKAAQDGRAVVTRARGAPTPPRQQTLAFVPSAPPPVPDDEPDLAPGVRYADEKRAPPPHAAAQHDERPALSPTLSPGVQGAVRGPAARPQDAAQTAKSIRETLRRKVHAIQADGASSRYLAKLDSIGLFDPAEPAEETPTAEPDERARKTAKKRATKKRRTTKRAATKQGAGSGRSTGKGSATKRKTASATVTATPKKTTTRKKATARKKTVARKKTAAKPRVQARATKKGPTRRKLPPESSASVLAARREAARKTAVFEALRIERLDPLFSKAVDAALERGAASPMLLTRRLGLPFARAKTLLERMITVGVLDEAAPTGSHALRITAAEWRMGSPSSRA